MRKKPTYEQLLDKIRDLESRIVVNHERYAEAFEKMSEFIYEHDLEGRFIEVFPHYIARLGYSKDEMVGVNTREMMPRRYRQQFDEYLGRVSQQGRDEGLMQVLTKDGRVRIVEYMNILKDGGQGGRTVIGIARDVTEQLEAEQALIESDVRFHAIMDSINDGYFEVDLAGRFTFFNNQIPEYLGYTQEELMGRSYKMIMDEKNAERAFKKFHKVFLGGQALQSMEWQLMKKDGAIIYIEASVSVRKNRKGDIIGFQGIVRDVTDRKRSEQELAFLAYHDALTGLYNRKAFMEKLAETIRDAKRYENRRAVLYLDLDSFKQVNDLYGHEIGDKLLVEVAERLKSILREGDYISRFGGDEFTIILINSHHVIPERVAGRIVKHLCAPYSFDGHIVDFISASVGISIYPDDGSDVETLLKRADQAMYRAKEHKNCFVRYTGMMRGGLKSRA